MKIFSKFPTVNISKLNLIINQILSYNKRYINGYINKKNTLMTGFVVHVCKHTLISNAINHD